MPHTGAKVQSEGDREGQGGKGKERLQTKHREGQGGKGKERLQTKRQERKGPEKRQAKRPAVAVKSSLTSLRMRLPPQSRKLGVLGLVGIGILRGVTGIAVPVGVGMNQAGTGSMGVGLGTVGVGMMGVVPGAGLTAGDHDRLHDVFSTIHRSR